MPAHKGIWGNELADITAKSAALSETIDIAKIPFTDLHERFKKECFKETQNSITAQGAHTGRTYFQLFYENKRSPWFNFKNLDRFYIVSINRIRCDHYNLAASLARLNIIDSPTCACKNDVEDINHVLWNCPKYDLQRQKLMSSLRKMRLNPPFNIEAFIASPCSAACAQIVTFLRECDIRL